MRKPLGLFLSISFCWSSTKYAVTWAGKSFIETKHVIRNLYWGNLHLLKWLVWPERRVKIVNYISPILSRQLLDSVQLNPGPHGPKSSFQDLKTKGWPKIHCSCKRLIYFSIFPHPRTLWGTMPWWEILVEIDLSFQDLRLGLWVHSNKQNIWVFEFVDRQCLALLESCWQEKAILSSDCLTWEHFLGLGHHEEFLSIHFWRRYTNIEAVVQNLRTICQMCPSQVRSSFDRLLGMTPSPEQRR